MPTTIKSTNWENPPFTTVGANINGTDGWISVDGSQYTIENTNVNTGSQAVQISLSILSGNQWSAFWNTNDGNGGNVQVASWFKFPTPTAQFRWAVIARATSTTNTAGNGTWYEASIEVQGSTSPGVLLQKRIAGVYTPLTGGTLSSTSIGPGIWYRLQLVCLGSAFSVNVQRGTDNQWLNSAGTFQVAPASCLTVSDSSILVQGKAGIRCTLTSTSDIGFMDDWLLEALATPNPLTPMFSPPRTQVVTIGY